MKGARLVHSNKKEGTVRHAVVKRDGVYPCTKGQVSRWLCKGRSVGMIFLDLTFKKYYSEGNSI